MGHAASPDELHATATRLRAAAADLRGQHRALRSEALGLAWQGPAARAFAEVRLARRDHALRTAEDGLEALATHLERAAHGLHSRLALLGPYLTVGDAGPPVVALQRMLAAAGHPPGPIDGMLGPRTAAAVGAFQREHALIEDGYVGAATALALAVRADGPPATIGTAVGAR